MSKPLNLFYLTLCEVAEMNGVRRSSFAEWAKRRGLYRHPYIKRQVRGHLVRIDLAEQYAAGRVSRRPKGWPTLKGVLSDLGVKPHTSLTPRLVEDLRVDMYHKTFYIHPDDIEAVARRWQALQPLPGYVPVRAAAPQLGRTRQALLSWAKKHGVPLREFLGRRHPALYIHERDLSRYAALVASRQRGRLEAELYTLTRAA